MRDIPPRIRLLLTVAAAGGFVFILMGSLASGGQQQIRLDKLIHGTGYALLGILVIMGLPIRWYLPALAGIALAGVALEFAQKLAIAGRSFELDDMIVNSIGLAAGALLGFVLRQVWGYVRNELVELAERKRLRHFAPGDVVFRENDPSECLYVIRSGKIQVTRRTEDGDLQVGMAAEGEVLGEMGVIEQRPRFATATVLEPAVLYRMEASDLTATEEGRSHPAYPVLRTLARRLRQAGEKSR